MKNKIMKLFLLRHTQSLGNKEKIAGSIIDHELSEEGKKDAKELVSVLSKNKYDFFIVSPLKRTTQTIQPFLDTLEKPRVVMEPLTIERSLGEFIGTPRGTFAKHCEENDLDRVSYRPKNGESIVDVFERAKKIFALITEKYKDESIFICGHKVFLHCLALFLTNEPVEKYYSRKQLANGEIVKFEK